MAQAVAPDGPGREGESEGYSDRSRPTTRKNGTLVSQQLKCHSDAGSIPARSIQYHYHVSLSQLAADVAARWDAINQEGK